MRFLVLLGFVPQDAARWHSGGAARQRMLIEALRELGEVEALVVLPPRRVGTAPPPDLDSLAQVWPTRWSVAFHEWPADAQPETRGARLRRWLRCLAAGAYTNAGGRFRAYAGSPSLADALSRHLARRPDLVLASGDAAMAPLLLQRGRLPPVVFDIVDDFNLNARRKARISGAPLAMVPVLLGNALRRWATIRAMRLAERTLVSTAKDANGLPRAGARRAPDVVPTALALPAAQGPATEPMLLFIGTLSYAPNADAVRFMLERIWPRVRDAVPAARFVVAGSGSDRAAWRSAQAQGVEFAGFVADLDALYARIRVCVCPLRAASGIRVKALEAAGYGKPIVATTMAVETLDLRAGEEVLVHDDPGAFADACIRLLTDLELCRRIGAAARARVAATYSREAVVQRVKAIALEAAAAGKV